jgi:hypothetical protein
MINLPRLRNTEQLEAAIPLAIKVAARPNDPNETIPREKMVAEDKLTAEGGLSETKVILGWHFNFRTLIVTLPEHKHITWLREILQMIASCLMTKQQLELTIRRLGHIGYVIPWVFYFLSRLWTLLSESNKGRYRLIKINKKCVRDLKLMQTVLDKARGSVHMNLLTFRSPDRIYYLDLCPAGLGGYSNQGQAW